MKRFLLSLLWFAVASSAHAAPVTLQFSGITSGGYGAMVVNNPLGSGTVPANTPYTATVTYDDAQVATPVSSPYGGLVSTYAFTDITVTMGGSTITQPGPGTIYIYDNIGASWTSANGDTIMITSGTVTNLPAIGPSGTLFGGKFDNIALVFVDTTGTALSSTALPSSINLASFQNATLQFVYTSLIGGRLLTPIAVYPISTASASGVLQPSISTASLPNGVYGVAYSAPISASGTNNDPITLSIDPATLPAGLSFNGTTISGTPTSVGTSSVAITAIDVVTQLSTSTHLPLIISDAAISFTPSISNAVASAAYSATLSAATGGTGSFTYTASGLPAGLSLTGSTIAGTAPANAGAYPFSVIATDSAGTAVSANLVLNVSAAVSVACSGSNAVESAFVPRNPGFITVNGGLNLLDHLWTTNLNAQNTTFQGGLVNWFSTGLILSYTGVTDPTGCILNSLMVSPAVSISTTSLANATVNSAYSAPILAAWGATPYQSISVSGQPGSLSFDGTNLVGTPNVVGTFPLTVTVIDAVGATASKTLSLVINDQAISFAPVLPAATVGTAYNASLAASGYAPFSYTASGLPAGLAVTGTAISGTPTTAGTAAVTLTATDAAGATASSIATLVVNPAAVVATSCTAPTGAKTAKTIQANVSAVNGTSVSIGTTVVTVPSCATISWKGNWTGLSKAIRVGYNVEVTKGYVVNGVTTASALIVDNGL